MPTKLNATSERIVKRKVSLIPAPGTSPRIAIATSVIAHKTPAQ
jgi:hypothetical protein